MTEGAIEHYSFSSYKEFNTCGHYFLKNRIEKVVPRDATIHTEFGQAMHKTLEMAVPLEVSPSDEELVKAFNENFDEFLPNITGEMPSKEDIEEFRKQGEELCVLAIPTLKAKFGTFEVVKAEEEIFESIDFYKGGINNFKGFIDLILKTADGKYIILDWKTTSWGWKLKKKADPMYTYQLTFYKYFFAKKYNIDVDLIETYFGFLKRTTKRDRAELFRVTSGPRKTNNALIQLTNTMRNVDSKRFIKNRLSCTYCKLYKTEHCR